MKVIAKIAFLIITLFIFPLTKVKGQCTPATSLPSWGIFPSQLPDGTVNESYSQDIQFKTNVDTVLSGVQAKIDSIRITAVLGLPPGITYQCNKPSCMVAGGEIGCLRLQGTSPEYGYHPLLVPIKTSGRVNIFGTWVQQNRVDTTKSYYIMINWHAGVFEVVDRSKPLRVYPNPAGNRLEIDVRSIMCEKAVLRIFNMEGRCVREEGIAVFGNPSLDISDLQAGVYFTEINTGTELRRAKFIKE